VTPLDDDERRARRSRRVLKLALLGLASAGAAYLGRGCAVRSYCPGFDELLAVATISAIMIVWFPLPHADRVVADDQGLLIYRTRVPWKGVRAIAWVYEAAPKAPRAMIEIRLRKTRSYKPPRARRLRFDPEDLEMTPAEFWMVVQERTPHHVLVLSTPPATGTSAL
jgi:hypothetical protein